MTVGPGTPRLLKRLGGVRVRPLHPAAARVSLTSPSPPNPSALSKVCLSDPHIKDTGRCLTDQPPKLVSRVPDLMRKAQSVHALPHVKQDSFSWHLSPRHGLNLARKESHGTQRSRAWGGIYSVARRQMLCMCGLDVCDAVTEGRGDVPGPQSMYRENQRVGRKMKNSSKSPGLETPNTYAIPPTLSETPVQTP